MQAKTSTRCFAFNSTVSSEMHSTQRFASSPQVVLHLGAWREPKSARALALRRGSFGIFSVLVSGDFWQECSELRGSFSLGFCICNSVGYG